MAAQWYLILPIFGFALLFHNTTTSVCLQSHVCVMGIEVGGRIQENARMWTRIYLTPEAV